MRKIVTMFRRLGATISAAVTPQAVNEVAGLVGIALFSYGAWLHYQPLGFLSAGAMLIAGACIGTLKGGR